MKKQLMLGEALGLQFKLVKHLNTGNVRWVRDYLAYIMATTEPGACPIDMGLIKRGVAFIEPYYRLNEYDTTDPRRVFTKIAEPPAFVG